jgi:hypothetical protein
MEQNIRSDFNKSIDTLSKEFLNDTFKDDYIYEYTGKVVNNNDKEKLGRCQIRVYNIFDTTIPDADLPWALPSFAIDSFIVPSVGSVVLVRFDRGDVYAPVYSTKVVDKSDLPSQRLKDYPNNLIQYETKSGDFYSINRSTGETTIHHRSGSSIKVNKDGSVELDAMIVKVKKSENNLTGGGVVIPNAGGGPFCAIAGGLCIMTGQLHNGYKVINT